MRLELNGLFTSAEVLKSFLQMTQLLVSYYTYFIFAGFGHTDITYTGNREKQHQLRKLKRIRRPLISNLHIEA